MTDRPRTCPECGRSLANAKALKFHKQIYHKPTGGRNSPPSARYGRRFDR